MAEVGSGGLCLLENIASSEAFSPTKEIVPQPFKTRIAYHHLYLA